MILRAFVSNDGPISSDPNGSLVDGLSTSTAGALPPVRGFWSPEFPSSADVVALLGLSSRLFADRRLLGATGTGIARFFGAALSNSAAADCRPRLSSHTLEMISRSVAEKFCPVQQHEETRQNGNTNETNNCAKQTKLL